MLEKKEERKKKKKTKKQKQKQARIVIYKFVLFYPKKKEKNKKSIKSNERRQRRRIKRRRRRRIKKNVSYDDRSLGLRVESVFVSRRNEARRGSTTRFVIGSSISNRRFRHPFRFRLRLKAGKRTFRFVSEYRNKIGFAWTTTKKLGRKLGSNWTVRSILPLTVISRHYVHVEFR